MCRSPAERVETTQTSSTRPLGECKSCKKIPAWIEDAMKQAKDCTRDGQLAIAVFHQDDKKYQDALVMIRLSELANLVKGER